jgi:hypothetical protein
VIVALYRHATREILLADSREPDVAPLAVPIADAAALADAINAAVRAPALAAELARA